MVLCLPDIYLWYSFYQVYIYGTPSGITYSWSYFTQFSNILQVFYGQCGYNQYKHNCLSLVRYKYDKIIVAS